MIYILSSFYTNESCMVIFFFFSSRRRHTRFDCDWSSDVCSSDLISCQRHRRRLLVWLWFPSLSWRPDVLGRERDRLEDGAGEVAEVQRTERWQMARGFAAAREIGGRGEGLRERRSGLGASEQLRLSFSRPCQTLGCRAWAPLNPGKNDLKCPVLCRN